MQKCNSTMLVNINIHTWNISGSERCLKYVLRRYSFHFYYAFWIVITFAFNMVSTVQSAFEWPFEFLYSYKLIKIYHFFWRSWVANTDHIGSLLKLQTSHRRIQMSHRRLQASHRRLQTGHRWLQTSHRRLQTSHRWLQTNHKQLQTSHRRVTDDYIQITPKVFLNTFIKHYFQKGYGFPNAPMKRWFLLKEGKSRIYFY